MSEMLEKLENEICSQLDAMNNYAVGDDEKRRGTENVEKLYKLYLLEKEKDQRDKDLEIREREAKVREEELNLKKDEFEYKKLDDTLKHTDDILIRNQELKLKEMEVKQKSPLTDKILKGLEIVLEAGAIIIPAALYDRVAQDTFEFEKTGIITSSFGKSITRVISPKQWFKK